MVVGSGRRMVLLSSTGLSIPRPLCICADTDNCGAAVASSNQCTATSAAILVFLCCRQWLLSICAFVSRRMATRAGYTIRYSTCNSSRDVAWCTAWVCATRSSGALMNRKLAVHQRRIIALLALAVLLPGCANTPSHKQEIARQHLSPGYLAEHHYAVALTRESWMLSGDTVDVTLMMPSGDGNFPLIVYLPGLGESAESSAAWRRPWAAAG
jgi:hypothetical protein